MSGSLDVTPILGEVIHVKDDKSDMVFPKIWDGERWQNLFSDDAINIMRKIAEDMDDAPSTV